jgi:hypothetical protein
MRNLKVGFCLTHRSWSDISSVPINRSNRDNIYSSVVIAKSQDFPMAPYGNALGIMMSPILFRAALLLWQLVAPPKTSINLVIYKTCDCSGNLTWISLFSCSRTANWWYWGADIGVRCGTKVTHLMLFDTSNVGTLLLVSDNRDLQERRCKGKNDSLEHESLNCSIVWSSHCHNNSKQAKSVVCRPYRCR